MLGRRDRARVHERIHSGAPVAGYDLGAFDRDDRIEAGARRVHANPLLDRLEALFLNDLRRGEHFRDRLDGHFRRHVAGGVDLPVGRHDRDAVQLGINLGERRNVVGILALGQVLVFRVCGVDRLLDIGRRLRTD
jgi:hypothetical protein